MRTSVAGLLAGVLISLVLAAGCAENEDTTEDQTAEQDTQRTKETTEERTGARAKSDTGKSRSGEAVLEMKGDSGTEFSGTCTVGDEETEVSGQVPESFTYELDSQRLDCEISKDSAGGNLQLDFTAGNTRSVQQVNQGTLNFSYDNGRISSFSSSSSGSSVQVGGSSQVISSSQGNSSSVKISP